jgi:hypothetical protein
VEKTSIYQTASSRKDNLDKNMFGTDKSLKLKKNINLVYRNF